MPVRCSVVGCGNARQAGLCFFTLPKNKKYAERWIRFAGVENMSRKTFCICSIHFAKGDIWKLHPRPLLKNDAVPSMHGANDQCNNVRNKTEAVKQDETMPTKVDKSSTMATTNIKHPADTLYPQAVEEMEPNQRESLRVSDMSTSLVRQSLDILDCDDNVNRGSKKKTSKSKGILHLIPSNQRIVTKKGKQEAKTVISRSSKRTIEEVKKLQLSTKTDQTEKNIERLLLLSGNRIDPETSDKLLNRALRKRYAPKTADPVEPEQTAFTEADFKQFEKEYHIE